MNSPVLSYGSTLLLYSKIQPPVALFNVASLTFNTLKLVEAVAQY